MSIFLALVIFSAIILFHELGHFLLAKKNGIAVLEFSLGMGPRLISFEKGGTRYSLKLLPLGGSCAMLGEDDGDQSEGAFSTKSPLARISVVAAGPIFNFILAFAASAVIMIVVGYDPAVVTKVEAGSPAETAGLMEGDVITEFRGEKIDISRQITMSVNLDTVSADEKMEIVYERAGEEYETVVLPQTWTKYMLGFTGIKEGDKIQITSLVSGYPMSNSKVREGDYLVALNGHVFDSYEDWNVYMTEFPLTEEAVTVTFERDGLLYEDTMVPKESTGTSLGFSYNTGRTKTTPFGVLKYSFIEVKYWIGLTIKSLGMLFSGEVGIQDLSGPVGVVDAIGETYNSVKSEGFVIILANMLNMAILLSANLGVMNLLPIPALDGGRLVFLLLELVRGKPIDREKEGMVHFAGIVALMALMAFVMFQDIIRLL